MPHSASAAARQARAHLRNSGWGEGMSAVGARHGCAIVDNTTTLGLLHCSATVLLSLPNFAINRRTGDARWLCMSGGALKLGAIGEEIAETLGVAVTMNAGAAAAYSARALGVVATHTESDN